MSHLEAVKVEILSASYEGLSKAGYAVENALSGIAWDWPLWHDFSRKEGYDCLPSIASELSKTTIAQCFDGATIGELSKLCKDHGTKVSGRKKIDYIGTLLATIDEDSAKELARTFLERTKKKRESDCRRLMGGHLAARISSIAYHLFRYEQLLHPSMLSVRPIWKFVCGENDSPRRCRKFDGLTLPASIAQATFPKLPCGCLRCHCFLTAHRE